MALGHADAELHPGHALLRRIRALALEQANRLRARADNPTLARNDDDARRIETFEATARLVEIIERDVHHLRDVCRQLAAGGGAP
jgi:hypothetical protein